MSYVRTRLLEGEEDIKDWTSIHLRLNVYDFYDLERAKHNKIYANRLDSSLWSRSDFADKLISFYRSLGIDCSELVVREFNIYADKSFFDGKMLNDVYRWAEKHFENMEDRFGEKLKFAILHVDEDRPHLICFVSQEKKANKSSWKLDGYLAEKDLKALEQSLERVDRQFGLEDIIDGKSYFKTFRGGLKGWEAKEVWMPGRGYVPQYEIAVEGLKTGNFDYFRRIEGTDKPLFEDDDLESDQEKSELITDEDSEGDITKRTDLLTESPSESKPSKTNFNEKAFYAFVALVLFLFVIAETVESAVQAAVLLRGW